VHIGKRLLTLVSKRRQRKADRAENENRHLEIGTRLAILDCCLGVALAQVIHQS
jgi:hypothetical protein